MKELKIGLIKYRIIFLSFLLLFSIVDTSLACRYNVRETGFVYLAQKPYQLIVYYSDSTSKKEFEVIRDLAIKHFANSNINPLLVNISSDVENREIIALIPENRQLLPYAVLKSNDGQTMELPLKDDKLSFENSVNNLFEKISYSLKREEIIQKCIDNYAVVLILEGADKNANKEARKVAELAIAHVKSKMDLMPKKIDAPPVVISIKKSNTDEVLNWSLGLENATFEMPKVFVIYGRGRWIGPTLEGDLISKKHLSELLLIVGADCECGIDREWMRGTMIPWKWNKENQENVANNLEFDPENPLIKKEVRNILRMGDIFGSIPETDNNIPSSENIFEQIEKDQSELPLVKDKAMKYTIITVLSFAVLIIVLAFFLIKRRRN